MNKAIMYYWKDEQVHEFFYIDKGSSAVIMKVDPLVDCYCYDSGAQDGSDSWKYGMYVHKHPKFKHQMDVEELNDDEPQAFWTHISKCDFPAGFKMALMLLGIE